MFTTHPYERIAEFVKKTTKEILDRPEIQKEVMASIEAQIRVEIPEEVRRRTADYIRSYDSGVRGMVCKGVDAWIQAHTAEIKIMIDELAERACHDESVYNEVAKHQFQRALSRMADDAVKKALAKSARKAGAKPSK